MLCCLNPDCPRPLNPDVNKFCQACSTPLVSLLRNRFRVMRVLSNEGGFGKTYLAEDTDKLNEHCVIKQLAPKVQGTWAVKKAMELFGEEAKRLQDLGEHPQIPTLFAYFEQDNFLYLVQQFIEGQNLLNELKQGERYSESKARELLLDLLPLLKFIHERQVIHRDIKPENIMRRQSDGRLVLIDFGASKQLTSTVHTQMGTTIGSHGYSPIEQIKGGEAYPASDLFALGATCFHLLTGIFPFDLWVENGFVWVYNWREYLPSPVSREFGQVLDKLLEKDIDKRYQFADKVIIDLTSNPPPPQQSSIPPRAIVPPPSSSVPPSTQRGIQLKSAMGIDYTRLHDLLAVGKWKDADEQTGRVILAVAKREKEGWLREEDINKFPCEDLRIIDQLWVKYSNGRFGFSVQKRIYQSLGGTKEYNEEIYEAFGDLVGWRKDAWIDYTNFTFTLKAPVAHLPVCWLRRGALGAFFSCVETCYLPNPTFTIQNLKLPKLDDVELISAVGMDYSRLRDLLAAGKWKLANQETERVMFIVAKREEEGWLRDQDIDNFPCEDLRTINQLWVEYSNGRFGFSVQKQIYQGFGESGTHLTEIWDTFGEAVGWKKRGGLWRCGWVNYGAITFDIKAPKGHLPVWKWTLYIHSVDNFNSLYAGGVDWGNLHGRVWISSLASRLVNCNI